MKMTAKRRNALKRILKRSKGRYPRFEYPFEQGGKQWFVCGACLVVLNEPIEWEQPKEEFSYPDIARLVAISNVPIELPDVNVFKQFAKDVKENKIESYKYLIGSRWVDVRLVIDVLEALPGAKAFVNKTGSLYLCSEDGIGYILPLRSI